MTPPEHPSVPTGPDPVADLLGGLRDGVAAPAPRSAAAARRTASRRQGARLAAAGAAVAVLVVGVPLGVSLGATEAAPLPPSISQPSPTAAAPTSAPPSSPDVPTPIPPAPSPSVGPTSPPPSSAAATAGDAAVPGPRPTLGPRPTGALEVADSDGVPVTAGELAGVDLGTSEPDDGETGVFGRATWSLDPCEPTAWPLDGARTGWASHGFAQGDGAYTREVAVYADEAAAEAALEAFRRVAEACWADPGDTSAALIWDETTPAGDEQTVFAGTLRAFDPEGIETWGAREGMVWTAVRQGRTVALVTSADLHLGGWVAAVQGDTRSGAGSAGDDAAGYVTFRLDDVRATAEQLLDQLAP